MPDPAQQTAVVTGASRGGGRGVAIALAEAGWKVVATGRSIEGADLPPTVVRAPCDHLDDDQTAEVFESLGDRLDLLVNNAWGGYDGMVQDGRFTWGEPFWKQPLYRWSGMIDAGLRTAFVSSQHAARLMVPAGRGLIVNISFWAAQKRLGNAIYGLAKAATDKLTADMAEELASHGVAAVSLYPGMVRTELVEKAARAGAFDLEGSESPQFIGRVVAALAESPDLAARSGKVLVAAAVARELGVTDLDGAQPPTLTLADV